MTAARVLTSAFLSTSLLFAQQNSGQPQFKAGTEIIRLDVSVLDKDRQPVRGLTAADFTIRESGTLQKIQSFAAVDVPDPVPPSAPWMREIAPDVQTNQVDDRRLVVLVLDNWGGEYESWESRTGKQVARDVVDKLGPSDVMCVVVVAGARYSQDFTADRALIKAAIEQKVGDVYSHNASGFGGDFVNVMIDVVGYLKSIPHRRKAIIYVGTGTVWKDPRYGDGNQRLVRLFHGAQAANVNIYCFDLNGLRPPRMPTMVGQAPVFDPGRETRDLMLSISDNTGGKATINTNRPTDGVPQIFVENGSYYLLGYETTNPKADGKTRRLEIKVNRPNVQVRYRSTYQGEPPPPKQPKEQPPVVQSAIAKILPDRTIPITVSMAPFASADLRSGHVAMAVGLRTADGQTATKTVEVLSRAFSPIGDPKGEQLQAVNVPVNTGPNRLFDVLTQMSVPAGRYEVRLAAHDLSPDTRGSVYAYVEVPDFARMPLSLSGVLLEDQAKAAGPTGALASIVPVVPTTRRSFARTERVRAFFRVYQGLDRPLAPATVAVSIVDSGNKTVFQQSISLTAADFDALRASDRFVTIPLSELPAGDHVLHIAASGPGKDQALRSVRFTVR